MILIFDIGNTSLRAAWLEASGPRLAWQAQHREQGIAATLASCPLSERPERMVVACVAGRALRVALCDWAQARWGIAVEFCISTASACGVRNAYREPQRLGIDRWLAVLAAYRRIPVGVGAALIVNAGTAVTIDLVTASGQHQGGLIAPGVGTQRRSLLGDTQVRARQESEGLRWLGCNTEEAVGFGTLHTVLGMIERVERGVQAPGSQKVELLRLLAGGEAIWLAPHLGETWQRASGLVLEGLAHWIRSEPSSLETIEA